MERPRAPLTPNRIEFPRATAARIVPCTDRTCVRCIETALAVGLGLNAHRKRRRREHGPRGGLTPDRPVDRVAPQKCPRPIPPHAPTPRREVQAHHRLTCTADSPVVPIAASVRSASCYRGAKVSRSSPIAAPGAPARPNPPGPRPSVREDARSAPCPAVASRVRGY